MSDPVVVNGIVTVGSWAMVHFVTRPYQMQWATLLFSVVSIVGAIDLLLRLL
jgi:hypothetical protein